MLFGLLLFPPARELGINEVHYATAMMLAMGTGCWRRHSGLAMTWPAPSGGCRQI